MRSNEPTLFLVWEWGTEAYGQERLINDTPYLRAVDLDIETARKHRDFLSKKGFKVLIESCSANHLFAEKCLGTLERIERRKPL